MLAFVFVEAALGHEASIKEPLSRLQGVLEAYRIVGEGSFDLVLKLEYEDEKKLGEVINKINSTDNVISSLASIIYNYA